MSIEINSFSLWFIGPSSVGKTTISKIIYNKVKKIKKNLILLDGDKIRNIYENNLGYDAISRSKNTRRYINLVKLLNENEISSIVAVISPFEKDRIKCKNEIENYFEINLKCSMKERIKRDKKKLYLPAIKGEKKNVVDVDIPFDEPKNCDFSINTENKIPEDIANEIIKKIKLL